MHGEKKEATSPRRFYVGNIYIYMSNPNTNPSIDDLLREITSIREGLDTLAEKIAVSQEIYDAAIPLVNLKNSTTPSSTTRKRGRKSENNPTTSTTSTTIKRGRKTAIEKAANELLSFNNNPNMTGGKASMNKKIHNVLQGITSRLQYVDQNLDNFSRTLTQKKKAAEVLFDFKGPGKRAVAKSRRRR
jgi:hypothetical protein